MNKETHNKETDDAPSRWWWPGQWLRIVWGVWVDQVWYWQNVHPRSSNRKQMLGIFMQSLLGTVLVALVLSAVLGGILVAAGVPVNWNGWTLTR